MKVYFDNAATTRVDPEVLKAMLPYFSEFYGNASSLHSFGREAGSALKKSRESVASLVGADADEIIFTAGGSESDNLAIKGLAFQCRAKGDQIITSSIEHPAVLETCRYLEERHGFGVTYLPVDGDGQVSLDALKKSLSPRTILITIMHANNEIGTIQPVEEIGKLARDANVPFHTDAVQSVGKVPIDVRRMGIDMLSLSSHKLHGPKGMGALFIRKGLKLEPLIHGGGHEKGLRSGTENIPGIVGLGKACGLLRDRMDADIRNMTALRDRIIDGVLQKIDESHLNGHRTQRLPNNANFRFSAIEGESLVLSLDQKGIATSTGSACSSKKLEPSHVLRAIGLPEVESHGSLRVTLSRESTLQEADYFLESLPPIVGRLRSMSPLWKSKK